MRKILCLILTVILALLCCSCGSDTAGESDRLTYYYSPESRDDMVEMIERYNRWCTSHSTDDMKIELIEFENYRTMSERLNIEVMTGGGPDLFSNYMDLPFEKMIQSGAFYDLNELIENDPSEDKLNLSLYNQAVMDAGVYDGKRYFIPAFYRVNTLICERKVLEKYNLPTEQGFHLTYENMGEVFADYLSGTSEYSFLKGADGSVGVNADTVALRMVNAQVDFDADSAVFDEDFTEKLELMKLLRERSETAISSDPEAYTSGQYLFDPSASHSNPIWNEFIMDPPEEIKYQSPFIDPVLYSCFEKDEDTYSACISDALFVNAKTKKTDKVIALIKYLLGEHLQNLYSGTDEEYWSGGGLDALPVLNSAYEGCIRTAGNIMDWYGNTIGVKEELHPTTQALIDHIGKINTVYLYVDLYQNNYDRSVALPILRDYWSGKTTAQKCADNLTSATKIYLLE